MEDWSLEELTLFLEQEQNGLLYLYTPFCGTCQVSGRMLMVVHEMLPHINSGKMNLNYYPDLALRWSVESVPCLLFIEKGSVVEKLYAFQSVPFLLEKINVVFAHR